VVTGIRLHRGVDAFCDRHPRVLASKRRFAPERRRYAGIITDLAYDHFLAVHWARFSGEPLPTFTARVYSVLTERAGELPEAARRVAARMAADDWLGGYRRLDAVGMALDRVALRLSRGAPLVGSVSEVRAHYAALEEDFLAFFPELQALAQVAGTEPRPPRLYSQHGLQPRGNRP
jgi:acyl carrier protein phosphodiesterase